MKNLKTFEEFVNESLLNESSVEVKKVEAFLKKNAKYDKANDLYTWDDAGVEFDVTLGRDEINLFDGEEDTKVSYKEFIKSWMGESTINEGDMTKDYDGFIVYDSKDEKFYKFRYVKGTNSVKVEDAAIDKLMKATHHSRPNFGVHGFIRKGEWNKNETPEFVKESNLSEAVGLGMAPKAFKDKDLYSSGNLRDNLDSSLKKFGEGLIDMLGVNNLDEIIQVDENSEEETDLGGKIFNMLSKKFEIGNDYKLAGYKVEYDKDLHAIKSDDMGLSVFFFTADSKF